MFLILIKQTSAVQIRLSPTSRVIRIDIEPSFWLYMAVITLCFMMLGLVSVLFLLKEMVTEKQLDTDFAV